MPKEIFYGKEAFEKLRNGAKMLSDAVSVTMGAKGQNVLIEDTYGNDPHITKDGVTVAKAVQLKDSVEKLACNLIKKVALRTNDSVGDGPQPLYAKVLTPEGFVPISSLVSGDLICGTNGSIQNVTGVYPKGRKQVFKVMFSDNRVVECSEDHLWTVTNFSGVKQTLTLRDIIKNGFKTLQSDGSYKYKYFVENSVVNFTPKETYIHPYLMGVLLGDGSLTKSMGNVEISLGIKKKFVIDKVLDVLPEGLFLDVKFNENKNYFRVKIKSTSKNENPLIDYLVHLGLYGCNSKNKFIPQEYLYNSIESRLQLLEGLSDTDGYINKRGLIEFSTVSDNLSENFKELLWSLGKSLNHKIHNRDKDLNSYSDTPIHRIAELKGYKYGNKIVDIIETNSYEEMMCIKVSNQDHLYFTDDYILTHNTTTATVLANAIVQYGADAIENEGINPVLLKRGIDIELKNTLEYLDAIKTPLNDDLTKAREVALVSANGDSVIADLVTEVYNEVGKDGNIAIEIDGNSPFSTYTKVEGVEFDRGFNNPYFITNLETETVEHQDAIVLISDYRINHIKELSHILQLAQSIDKPLLIIAEDIDPNADTLLAVNNMKGALRVSTVSAPEFGDRRLNFLEDLAVITGGTFISSVTGKTFDDVVESDFGRVKKFIQTRDTTSIIGGEGDKDLLAKRLEGIKSQIEHAKDEHKSYLEKRYAKIRGGFIVIKVGGYSEVERREIKDRVEDAVNAVKSALIDGIIPGGGSALLRISMTPLEVNEGEDSDIIRGRAVLKYALKIPFNQILVNAGLGQELQGIVKDIVDNKENLNIVYDVNSYELVDGIEKGIIDPVLVTKTALINASSVAGTLLTTGCTISFEPEGDKNLVL